MKLWIVWTKLRAKEFLILIMKNYGIKGMSVIIWNNIEK